MNELVSIIIPAYNVADDIEKCLDSVLRQTYQNIEVIIVDDGSTDNTAEILRKYKKYDDRIKVFQQSNQGISVGRNNGIKYSSGKYLSFVDSDDYVDENYIEYLVQLIENFDCQIAVCGHQNINPQGEEMPTDIGNEYVMSAEEYFRKLGINKLPYGMGVSPHSRIYARKLFDGIQYPEGMNFEDSYVTFQLMDKAKKTAIGEKIKYFYVRHTNSIVQNGFNAKRLEFITAEKFMVRSIQKKYPNISSEIEYRLDYAYLNTLGHAVLSDNMIDNKVTISRLVKIIAKRRWKILFGKNSPKRNRVGMVCLLPGVYFYRWSFKLFKRIQKTK